MVSVFANPTRFLLANGGGNEERQNMPALHDFIEFLARPRSKCWPSLKQAISTVGTNGSQFVGFFGRCSGSDNDYEAILNEKMFEMRVVIRSLIGPLSLLWLSFNYNAISLTESPS